MSLADLVTHVARDPLLDCGDRVTVLDPNTGCEVEAEYLRRLSDGRSEVLADGPRRIVEVCDGDVRRREAPRRIPKRSTALDILDQPPPDELVERLLFTGETAILYGPPGSKKSFVALDLLWSIANGDGRWADRMIVSGPCVYCAGEGARMLGLRLRSLYHDRVQAVEGKDAQGFMDLQIYGGAVHLLDDGEFEEFLAELREVRPVVVCIDTLSQAIAGSNADENSNTNMADLALRCDRIAGDIGATVILVAHDGKAAGGGPRGAQSLLGNFSVVLRVRERFDADGRAIVQVTSDKMKDSAAEHGIEFLWSVVNTGHKSNFGRELSSLAMRFHDSTESVENGGGFHGRKGRAYSTLIPRLREPVHGGSISVAELKRLVEKVPDSTLYNYINAMIEEGYVERATERGHRAIRLTELGRAGS